MHHLKQFLYAIHRPPRFAHRNGYLVHLQDQIQRLGTRLLLLNECAAEYILPENSGSHFPPLLFLVRSFPSPKGAPPLPGVSSCGWGSGGAGRPFRSNGVRVRNGVEPEGSDVGFEDKVGSGVVREADERHAREAVEALKGGKVIAVPTDTLYGICISSGTDCSLEAVNRIYEIKGRKHTSPLAICVGDVSDIDRFAVTDHLPNGLLYSLLPGPVTVILRARCENHTCLWME
ncbi:hypothetical protein MLD38_009606 [Melastoma candidum]|uniref:Uncharacterized protein n=1 Tax=Melastoma candidum TaxID=119954 RepID=A0ACB9S2E7_9MYRT|nr:hypothetical protein MLD38_009606 [Melastoma candidum]